MHINSAATLSTNGRDHGMNLFPVTFADELDQSLFQTTFSTEDKYGLWDRQDYNVNKCPYLSTRPTSWPFFFFLPYTVVLLMHKSAQQVSLSLCPFHDWNIQQLGVPFTTDSWSLWWRPLVELLTFRLDQQLSTPHQDWSLHKTRPPLELLERGREDHATSES